MQRQTALAKWALRLAVSLGFLTGVVLLVPDRDKLLDAARGISPITWLAALVLFLGGHVLMAFKWWLLMGRASGAEWPACYRGHFAGQAANLLLPGVSGADVIRLLLVVRAGAVKEDVAVASIVDRLCDLVALLVLATAGAVLTAQWSPAVAQSLMWLSAILAAGCLFSIFALVILRRYFSHDLWQRLGEALLRLRSAPARVAVTFALSLCVQAAFVSINALLGRAAGVTAPWAAWFFAWPLAKLVALLPVSLAGLGVRDMALVFFLEPLGGTRETVAAAALAWSSIIVAAGLLGGMFLAMPQLNGSRGISREPSV